MRPATLFRFALVAFAIAGMGPAHAQVSDPQAYLSSAIELLKARHINRHHVDWPTLEAEARSLSEGASEPAETYPAIRHVIASIGERHTFLMSPEAVRRQMEGRDAVTGAPRNLAVPSVSFEGGVATVAVPPFAGGVPLQRGFAEAGRQAMAAADARGVCGWVVDLSANTGGNMWPMLNAIIGVLGEPPFGAFVSPEGHRGFWTVSAGEAVPSDSEPHLHLTTLPLKSSDAPLVVIIGPRTASSGEFTTLALRGRPSTIIVGLPSAGLITANGVFPLSDGAALVVSTAWGEDRTGRREEDRIYPDVATGNPRAVAAQWLKDMGCGVRPARQLTQAGQPLRR